jgi:hypothetical protein
MGLKVPVPVVTEQRIADIIWSRRTERRLSGKPEKDPKTKQWLIDDNHFLLGDELTNFLRAHIPSSGVKKEEPKNEEDSVESGNSIFFEF